VISQHLLSNNQYFYITSQEKKLSSDYNKSQELKRIEEKFQAAFKTFELISHSKSLSQAYKDKLFHSERISNFIGSLIFFEDENTRSEEINKQAIARQTLQHCFAYFQMRYKHSQFLSNKIKEIEGILLELDYLTKDQSEDDEALEFYRMRSRMKLPPRIGGSKNSWYSVCIICWSYGAGNNKSQSMKEIRHHKHCLYDKNELERCIKVTPPSKS